METIDSVVVQGNRENSRKERSYESAADLVLRGIQQGVTDPEDLKKMASIRSSAELFVTMDKLAMRKEYHAALAKHGLSIDALVAGIAEHAFDMRDRKMAFEAKKFILKTLSLDRFANESTGAKGWQDLVLEKAMQAKDEMKALPPPDGLYEVEEPEVPSDMREMAEKTVVDGRAMREES
jgi:hypothetical protein